MPYQTTEHHPAAALPQHHQHYIHTGRGGAGNTIRITPSSSSSSPAKPTSGLTDAPSKTTSSIRSPSAIASTGRGGAGNMHPQHTLPSLSLSDEVAAQAARECGHDVWHVGRGGAGNWSSAKNGSGSGERKFSSGSEGSAGSGGSDFLGRLSGAWERR